MEYIKSQALTRPSLAQLQLVDQPASAGVTTFGTSPWTMEDVPFYKPTPAEAAQLVPGLMIGPAATRGGGQPGTGIAYGGPTYGGTGYSAPYGISAPVSTVTQSPTISPVQTAFAQAPDIYITQREQAMGAMPPTGMLGGSMGTYVIVGLLLAMMIAMVMMSRRR